MRTVFIHVLIYLGSFLAVWITSGWIVSAIALFSQRLRLPRFIVSFFLLGILTSLPEISIGTVSIINNDPVVYIGNLIGGTVVLFLLIIPLLGILGNGVKMPTALTRRELFCILLLTLAPSLVILDQNITVIEGFLLVGGYLVFCVLMLSGRSLAGKIVQSVKGPKKNWNKLFLQLVLGILILFFSSQQIVNSTVFFAEYFHLSQFIVSLIVVSIGTNIPELSLVVRSILRKQKDVALADYLGSALANTPILGLLTIFYGKTVNLIAPFYHQFLFVFMGLVLFFIFSKSGKSLSQKESGILILFYLGFLVVELLTSAR